MAQTQAADGAAAVVSDVRVAQHGNVTRLVLDISAKVSFRIFALEAPDRVVLDLPQVGWRLPQKPLPTDVGVLSKLRYGLYKPGTTRVVLDMVAPAEVKKAFILEPSGGRGYRFVIDLSPTTREAFSMTAGRTQTVNESIHETDVVATVSPSPPALEPVILIPPKKPSVRVIAIDPGHGGADPGTQGPSGSYEKYITLAAAQALKVELEATGRFRVVLTRERDIFIRLRERIAIARAAGAELFISLHADAIKNKTVRGVSVYTLSETASDTEAAALAEKENKADLISGMDLSEEAPEVADILIDLAQRETMNQSSHFASLLVSNLGHELSLLRNTHRFAGFAVLKAPDVPSILLEMGFLSNREDERALKSKKYRQQLARAITLTMEGYFTRIEEAQRK